MALNWTMLNPNDRSPVPLPNEAIMTTVKNVEMKILIPPADSESVSAGKAPQKTLEAFGNVYFTDQRVGFSPGLPGWNDCSIDAAHIH